MNVVAELRGAAKRPDISLQRMALDAADEVERFVTDMRAQLQAADAYAAQARSKDDVTPTVWQIQSGHLRDLLDALTKPGS